MIIINYHLFNVSKRASRALFTIKVSRESTMRPELRQWHFAVHLYCTLYIRIKTYKINEFVICFAPLMCIIMTLFYLHMVYNHDHYASNALCTTSIEHCKISTFIRYFLEQSSIFCSITSNHTAYFITVLEF